MFPESFDTKFSRVACLLFELRHLLPKIFQNPPGHEDINIFQKKICNGFLCQFVPCKSCYFEKTSKSGKPYYLGESFLIAIYFLNKQQSNNSVVNFVIVFINT